MNLILVNLSEGSSFLFVSNLKFDHFINVWGSDVPIEITGFYGYNQEKYFYQDSVTGCKNLAELKNFIELNKVKIVNNIQFESKLYQVEINDMYNYTIRKHETDISFLSTVLYKATGFNLTFVDYPEKLMNKYLLVNKQEIIKEFSSFDEYLNSEFDEES
jgi:hypothetical protein